MIYRFRNLLNLLTIKATGIVIIAVFIIFPITLQGQDDKRIKATITTWYQNKPGAVSITFDDAGYTQYMVAYPVLEKYGFKATFSLVGSWVGEEPSCSAEPGHFEIRKMGWPQLLELAGNGHELAAHGFYHEKYNKLSPVADLATGMKQVKDLIESRTNRPVYTICYPYSFASGNIPLGASAAGYLFGRTGLDTINPASPSDTYLLASMAILNAESPDPELFAHWLENANGQWLILMYHHLFSDDSREIGLMRAHGVSNTYSVTPEVFGRQMEELSVSGYWIAPLCEIGKYIAEREHTEIKVHSNRRKIAICMLTNLDKTVYNVPLTLEIELPWKKVKVKGSVNDGIFGIQEGRIYINVLPEKKLILTRE